MDSFELRLMSVVGSKPAAIEISKAVERLANQRPFPLRDIQEVAFFIVVSLSNNPTAVIDITDRYLELKHAYNGQGFFQ